MVTIKITGRKEQLYVIQVPRNTVVLTSNGEQLQEGEHILPVNTVYKIIAQKGILINDK